MLSAMVKFLFFAPIIAVKHSFLVGFLLNTIAGTAGVSLFYFLSSFFLERSAKKAKAWAEMGIGKRKKKFTFFNKALVRIKRTFGMRGMALLTPIILSIPVGSIVMAKIYGNEKWTYPTLIASVAFWALLFGGIASLFPELSQSLFPSAYE